MVTFTRLLNSPWYHESYIFKRSKTSSKCKSDSLCLEAGCFISFGLRVFMRITLPVGTDASTTTTPPSLNQQRVHRRAAEKQHCQSVTCHVTRHQTLRLRDHSASTTYCTLKLQNIEMEAAGQGCFSVSLPAGHRDWNETVNTWPQMLMGFSAEVDKGLCGLQGEGHLHQ